MAICSFFLRGQCKYGSNCRNEHPQDAQRQSGFGNQSWTNQNRGSTSTETKLPFTMETMGHDITPHKDKPMWPLSSFGPAKNEPTLISGLDESPEELRVRATTAQKSGTPAQYATYESEKIGAADQVYASARANLSQAFTQASKQSPLLASQNATSAFGSTSAFGAQASTSAFGAAASTSTFGKSAFGNIGNTTTTSAFGNPTTNTTTSTFNTTGGSGFGKPGSSQLGFGQSAFGQVTFGQTAFGQPAAQAGASTSAFGQAAAPTTASAFGQTSTPPTVSGFSQAPLPSTTSAFGQPSQPTSALSQPVSAFGQSSQPVSAFGQSSQTSSIIKPASGAFSALNSTSTTNAFGGGGFSAFASQPSAFGSGAPTTQPPAGGSVFGQTGLGQQTTSAFGNPAPTTSAFGNPTPGISTFGTYSPSISAFGSSVPAASAFGIPAPATSGFGNPASTTSPFGAPTVPTTSAFGNLTQPATSAFGNSTPTTSAFGNPTPSAFGTSSFGSNSAFPVQSSNSLQPPLSAVPMASPTASGQGLDFSKVKSVYVPGITAYDTILPPDYMQRLPEDALEAFQDQKFQWGKIPVFIPPMEVR